VPIPGASAAVAAISAAGLVAGQFLFLGFLPKAAKARRELLATVARLPVALVVYEAPHRVRDTVAHLGEALGGARTLVVARELTKKFESITRTTLNEAPAWFAADPNHERGEFVLLVDAPPETEAIAGQPELDLRRLLTALVAELPPARAARVAAAATGLPRDAIYAQALALKSERR
jgi:16S rRNA (cytidine1402-2'-O)-methyltransferase